jgi:outer membrane receptor protein involved in Fe transport
VLPDVPTKARGSIQGRVKVNVRIRVDLSGSLGASANVLWQSVLNNIQIKDDLSWTNRRHSFKFGFDGLNRRFVFPNPSNDKGTMNFANTFTQACPVGNARCDQARRDAGLPVGGNQFADYLLGTYASTVLILRQMPYAGRQNYIGAYAQDTWRLTNRLTVNLGLRYEYWSPWEVPRNTTVTFDFSTGQPKFALQNPSALTSVSADAPSSHRECLGPLIPPAASISRRAPGSRSCLLPVQSCVRAGAFTTTAT